jgi:class 3 adenylate cyclase
VSEIRAIPAGGAEARAAASAVATPQCGYPLVATLEREYTGGGSPSVWRLLGGPRSGRPLPSDLLTGTVTFLFSDIEGSTRRLLQRLGDDYARVLREHQALLRAAWVAHGGVEVNT